MKILYDHQIFSIQIFGGISRYFQEMSSVLENKKNFQTDFSVKISNNFYLSPKTTNFYRFLKCFSFKGKIRIIYFVNKLYTIYILKKKNFDVFHPTYYDPYFLKYLGDKKFVLTVYDMIHEKFPEKFSQFDKTTQNKKLLVNKASKIIAISESTKTDLINIFKVNPLKIEVIYLATSLKILNGKNPLNKIKLPNKYILYVGSRDGYKNFMFFLSSIINILLDDSSLNLVCAGGGKFSQDELNFFESNKIKDQLFQFDVNDSSLSFFYSNASAFVFPSIYEGFGLPILESFACGCPLICSNTSSLKEIALDAAIFFDPLDKTSINNAVSIALNDYNLRSLMVEKGHERLKFFSWQKTAQLTEKIYESIT